MSASATGGPVVTHTSGGPITFGRPTRHYKASGQQALIYSLAFLDGPTRPNSGSVAGYSYVHPIPERNQCLGGAVTLLDPLDQMFIYSGEASVSRREKRSPLDNQLDWSVSFKVRVTATSTLK